MALSDVIGSFAEAVTVLRRPAGDWAAGVYQRPPVAVIAIDAVVLPVSGRELDAVPEGLRDRENKQFLSKVILHAAGATGFDSDVVVHGGVHYRIHTVTDWSQSGFSVAIGAREEDA